MLSDRQREMHPDDLIAENYSRYKRDPWAFLSECVFTQDQVDVRNPVKLFPAEREYLRLYVRIWQRYFKLLVPKSRRMTLSWTTIGLYLWDTIFHRVRDNAFVSKEQEAAGELVGRAEFIFDHIPKQKLPPELLPKKKIRLDPPLLGFPEFNSQIKGWANMPDKLRQYTFSGIFGDEIAFWQKADKFYSASEPTTEGGGRMTLVSSPAPAFFKRLVFDNMEHKSQIYLEPGARGLKVLEPMPGIRIWINEGNNFCVMEIHYTADPMKRSRSFRESLKSRLPVREYLQEYELHWDSFTGMPVYGDFNIKYHVTTQTIEADPSVPLLVGWDFGLHPAALPCQFIDGQLRVLREYTASGEGLATFGPRVMSDMRQRFPAHQNHEKDIINYLDPQGIFARDDNINARTCAMEMKAQGWRNLKPGPQTWTAREQAVTKRLIKVTRSGPAIIMNETQCPMLVKGFKGGYQFPESNIEIEPSQMRPIKNEFSHPHDALQYVCHGVRNLDEGKSVIHIPPPKYQQGEIIIPKLLKGIPGYG